MPNVRYVFDVVFGPDSTQEEVYTATTKHLVDNVMKVVLRFSCNISSKKH